MEFPHLCWKNRDHCCYLNGVGTSLSVSKLFHASRYFDLFFSTVQSFSKFTLNICFQMILTCKNYFKEIDKLLCWVDMKYELFLLIGCNQNGGWFGSCVNSATTCSKTSSCASNEDYCLIYDSCIPKTDPCTCSNRQSTYLHCINTFVGSSQPKYRIRGQTYVNLPPGGEVEYSVPATGFTVYENDVLAFATNASVEVIKCDSSTSSDWNQNYNEIPQTAWLNVNDEVTLQSFSPTSHVCYFNLMYTSVQQESLPTTLQYFTNPDNYTYTLNVPTLSGSSQTATIKSEEEVGEITWINPAMQSSAVNVLDNSDTYFVFRVTKGTHLMANWTKDGVVTSAAFESSCPSAIATKYPTECSQANHRPYVFSSQLYKFLRSTGVSQNITVLVYLSLIYI